jgi:ATP-binding cassette subfamily F protein 3
MLHLVNLTLAFGWQRILEGVNWHIGPRERIGLVGNNGSGKSTLMKMIVGQLRPDAGEVVAAKHVTKGYLPQGGLEYTGRTLFDEAASAFGDLQARQQEAEELLALLEHIDPTDPEYERIASDYAEVEEQIRMSDGYQIEQTVERILVGLGFSHSDMGRDCGEFSGGWQMRIALSKVLLARPNMMLLDEPTNYLDLEARNFLREWLRDYQHAVLMVSHDRFFLDQVVGRITEIHDAKLTDYTGNYSTYEIEREKRMEQLLAQAEQIHAERERIQQFVNRFRYNAQKASLVQSRIRQLEKLESIELPSVRKKIRFSFPQPERSGKIAISAENVRAGYGDGPDVVKNVNFSVARGEKIALVGVNGAGKSTMMKILAGNLVPREGAFSLGHNVTMEYFAQEAHKSLDGNATVYQTVESSAPFEMGPHLRNLLGAFLFSGDEIDKRVSVLSGGERNRLVLARMLLRPANLLLLDEPTNHLDLDAKDVLLDALQRFDGTILFVSHDRHFLDNLATKIFALDHGELYVYPGTYPEFLRHLEARGEQVDMPQSKAVAAGLLEEEDKQVEKQARIARYEDEKRRKRERQRLEKLVARLEEEVEAKEAGVKTLVRQMAEPQYATNFGELEKLAKLKSVLDKQLSKLTAEWEDALQKLEKLDA